MLGVQAFSKYILSPHQICHNGVHQHACLFVARIAGHPSELHIEFSGIHREWELARLLEELLIIADVLCVRRQPLLDLFFIHHAIIIPVFRYLSTPFAIFSEACQLVLHAGFPPGCWVGFGVLSAGKRFITAAIAKPHFTIFGVK